MKVDITTAAMFNCMEVEKVFDTKHNVLTVDHNGNVYCLDCLVFPFSFIPKSLMNFERKWPEVWLAHFDTKEMMRITRQTNLTIMVNEKQTHARARWSLNHVYVYKLSKLNMIALCARVAVTKMYLAWK